jgi:hypothetical protein
MQAGGPHVSVADVTVILTIVLVAGFALGYGVRELISRRRHRRYREL